MHISLDSAIGQQRRLNQVGETISSIAAPTAAYSLRSLTGGDPLVVRVRRISDDSEQDFTVSEINSGALLNFVNKILTVGTAVNGTGSVDNYTVTGASTTGFSADNSAGGTGSAGFPYTFADDDVMVVRYTVTNFSSTSSLSPQLRGVNALNSTTGKTNAGSAFTANGTYTDTLTATADGTHLMFADGNTGSYTISDFEIVSHSTDGRVQTWYDQSGNGNHAPQTTASLQALIVSSGSLVSNGLDFQSDTYDMPNDLISSTNSASAFVVAKSDLTSSNRTGVALSRNDPDFRFYVPIIVSSNFNFGYQDSAAKIPLGSADTGKHLFTGIAGSSNAEGFLDGTSKGTVSSADGKSALSSGGIGSINSSVFWDGTIQEIIIYNSDQTANRTAIETNINSHYSIF